jgi:glucose/arabinose dehydrogenase
MRITAVAALLLFVAAPVAAQRPGCDPGNAGLMLPNNFCAQVIVDSIAAFRHLVVRDNGDIFVGAQGPAQQGGGFWALRDADGDGRLEVRERIWETSGNGVAMRGDTLYFATDAHVLRFRIPAGQLRPAGAPDTIVMDLPATQSHTAKTIVLGRGNELFVNIGSPSNVCQTQNRPGVPGLDPCPELETRAGVWRFRTDRLRQKQADGVRFATGLRNMVALTLHPTTGALYGAQHGRDNLYQNWGQFFNAASGAELPAEEFMRIEEGDDFGWPYCFYNRFTGRKLLAPEYGGDGMTEGRCANVDKPLVGYPAHWAPNAIVFYTGTHFPERYRGGVFIAFHGSWNRAPLPQSGFNVAFQRFDAEGQPTADWQVFADRFLPARPVGLAVGPDGSLYVSADTGRRIYRIRYTGQ